MTKKVIYAKALGDPDENGLILLKLANEVGGMIYIHADINEKYITGVISAHIPKQWGRMDYEYVIRNGDIDAYCTCRQQVSRTCTYRVLVSVMRCSAVIIDARTQYIYGELHNYPALLFN